MAQFVHLTPERYVKKIRKHGIRKSVYAVPVTPDHFVTFQWVRELRKWHGGSIYAIYFRIPDDEQVQFHHFSGGPSEMSANEAVAAMMEVEETLGHQVVIDRRITTGEIFRVEKAPQVSGWRHSPNRSRKPCYYCMGRGEPFSKKLKQRLFRELMPHLFPTPPEEKDHEEE